MNTPLTALRTLILKDLDPAYFCLNEQEIEARLVEITLIKEQIIITMDREMLGELDNYLVERHLKQVQYDVMYLMGRLRNYEINASLPAILYGMTGDCLDHILDHIENHYSGFLNMQNIVTKRSEQKEHMRIRVLFSVDALAYFFKLLNKAGGLDAGPVKQLITAISKNFITPGLGEGYISPHSLDNKYSLVVQTTARKVRTLLVKMLKHLDEEFQIV